MQLRFSSPSARVSSIARVKLKVSEMVETLIGEEPAAGYPCLLIRLSGCNLRCKWCDTQSKNEFVEDYSVVELIVKAQKTALPWILLTGGEPLLQPETPCLVKGLIESGFKVLIETNGTVDLSDLPKEVVKSVDIKTPSSGYAGSFLEANLPYITEHDALKFVIENRADYNWALSEIKRLELKSGTQIIFSPVFEKLEAAELASWILNQKLPIRLSIQIHKILGIA